MKRIMLFEDFDQSSDLEDIKWSAFSAFDLESNNILQIEGFKNDSIVLILLESSKEYSLEQNNTFREMLKDIRETYIYNFQLIRVRGGKYLERYRNFQKIVIQDGQAIKKLLSSIPDKKNQVINNINKFSGKWINISDYENSGLYDFNFKIDLDGNNINVELEEGSELQSMDGEIFNIKNCMSGFCSDDEWEIAGEVQDLIKNFICKWENWDLITKLGDYKGCMNKEDSNIIDKNLYFDLEDYFSLNIF